MSFLRHIIGLLAVLLFSALSAVAMPTISAASHQADFSPHQETGIAKQLTVFGASMVLAVPMSTSELSFYQAENVLLAQSTDVGFTACAPPMAMSNVATTGGANVMHRGAFVLHGQETVAALFGFDGGFIATNRILTQIDEFVDVTNGRSGHILANHRAGAGKPGKTEFPDNWSDQRVIHQVSDIATDPSLVRQVDNRGTPSVSGTRDGVDITVTFFPDNHPRAGQIASAYLTNVPANPRP